MLRKLTGRTNPVKNQAIELPFDIERLESRKMLAGNVTANVTNAGHLVINGDGNDNSVSVSVDEFGGASIVGSDGTTVDLGNVASAQVTGDIRITMKGGDDAVHVVAPYSDFVKINGGSGNDIIQVEYTYAEMNIIGGSGDDCIEVKYCGARGTLAISGGGGNDDVVVGNSEFVDIVVNGQGGNDFVSLVDSYADEARLSLGGGDDNVALIDAATSGDMKITTGSGDDKLDVTEAHIVGKLSANLGGGNDIVEIGDTEAGRTYLQELSVNTGGGSDRVDLKYADVSLASNVITGGGNDQFSVLLNNFGGGLDASGGGGLDNISIPDAQAGVVHDGFETITS